MPSVEETLRPASESGLFKAWKAMLAKTKVEEVSQTATDPAVPAELTRGMQNTASGQADGMVFKLPKLNASQKIIGLTLHWYGTGTAAVSFKGVLVGSGTLPESAPMAMEKGTKWMSYGTAGANGGIYTVKELEEKAKSEENITAIFTSEKAAAQTINEMYMVIVIEETETGAVMSMIV